MRSRAVLDAVIAGAYREAMTGETSSVLAAPVAPRGLTVATRWIDPRFALLLVVLVVAVCGACFGSRTATMSQLNAAITAGRVTEVRVNGALEPGASGSGLVHIFWRDGLISYVTQVVQQSDIAALPPAQFPGDQHIVGDLVAQLRSVDGSGSLQVRTDTSGLSFGPTVAGWQLPIWFGLVLMAVWLAVVALILHGPEPLWATRWAWFWLVSTSASVGVPLFLLMSGPPPGVPQPAHPGRRLTGGWAFLVSGVLAYLSNSLT